jgi:lactose/L-arabinose transport system ATP-binding protein
MAGLQLHNIVKRFGQVEVIHGVSLRIEDGEFVVFVGPSGCGKSTMLRIIAGLEDSTQGEIWIADRNVNGVDPANRGVAMVFQTHALYPHMSVEENMGFGLRMAKRPKQEIKARVAHAAEILHLTPYLKRRPKELSGGERQRVAIGRAIVREPEVFLFDEPLSNLDSELRVQLRIEIAKLHSNLQTTMVYVTHDQVEAMTLADKIVVLNEGKIEQVGVPADIYQRPANLFVAGFFGSPKMNFLKVSAEHTLDRTIVIAGPDFPGQHISLERAKPPVVASGAELTLGLRPEHLQACEPGKGLGTLVIEVVENLGDLTFIHGTTATGSRLTMNVKGFQNFRHSDAVGFGFHSTHAHLFDSAGKAV